jgi:hypothetical protein
MSCDESLTYVNQISRLRDELSKAEIMNTYAMYSNLMMQLESITDRMSAIEQHLFEMRPKDPT